MALENLISPDILVPLAVFSMPVACLWIKKHYAALEKGLIKPALPDGPERLAALERHNQELKARVENLESIVCLLDGPPTPRPLAAPKPGAPSA
jgi:hypothetical protein